MYVRRFLGVDISRMIIPDALKQIDDAGIMRELEVGIFQEAIIKAFDGE